MQTLQQLQAGELAGAQRLKLACGLTEFPREILDLKDTLEILDLTGNQLSELPAEFSQLRKLKIAFFSDNLFTEFPAVLGQCPQLEMVGFKSCRISHIPENALAPSLRWLILTNNRISRLPAAIGHCHRMQKLMLAGNKLKELPAELANCQKLELLRISANQLSALPEWLFTLPKLSWLAISENLCTQHNSVQVALPEVQWQDLELEEHLGEGASGIISKAKWQIGSSTQQVAVKVFKGEVTSDGLPQNEMQTCMAAGAHPNLVQVLGRIAQHPAQKQGLVFELIPPGYRNLGEPPSFETCTRDVYPEGTVFTLHETLSIALGIASAAAHLHARGIMHGDLYAHNTLVNEVGHPLFGDFGAASLYDKADVEMATALERIEVRAYGCFLEDLLNHLDLEEPNQKMVGRLQQLKQDCMQAGVLQRPAFATIVSFLESLA
ncbi:MAG: leucine-rich repeat-containing protein kinase family protein [Rufibacter sp.]